MKNESQIEAMIQAKNLTAPRVTPEHIQALMDNVFYRYVITGTSTFCHSFLKDKFFLATGHSACVSPENFNEGIGRQIAFDNAALATRNKLWELEGYRLFQGMSQ